MKQRMYHHNDPDGFASAAAFLLKYPSIELIPCIYGDKIEPVTDYDLVIVADYHFDQEMMDFLKENNKEFIWIDHHQSSKEQIKGTFKGIIDTSKAASQLCWEYIFPDKPLPQVVLHIAEDDIWKFNHPKTKGFMLYLNTILKGGNEPQKIKDIITSWDEEQYTTAYEKGELLELYRESQLEEQAKRSVRVFFDGVSAALAFTNNNISHLGHHLLEKYPDVDIAIMVYYKEANDGSKQFKYSLRSRKEGVNVAKLASKYGGGGHPQAAGFEHDMLILD